MVLRRPVLLEVAVLVALFLLVAVGLKISAAGSSPEQLEASGQTSASPADVTVRSKLDTASGKVELGPAARLKIRSSDSVSAASSHTASQHAGATYTVKDEAGTILETGQLGYLGEANIIQLPGLWLVEVNDVGGEAGVCTFATAIQMSQGERAETEIVCPAT